VRIGGIAEAGPNRTGHTGISLSAPVTAKIVNQSGLGLSLWFFACTVVHFIGTVMKNIAISGTWFSDIPGGDITTTIVDVDKACLWIASERLNADADTEIDIYKKGLPGDSYEVEDVSPPLKDPRPQI
jgi:hypothetical protein